MKTPREITSHRVNACNEAIAINVLDEPGSGGASHLYEIDLIGDAPDSGGSKTMISFQNGPIKEAGVNGITQEALIAICIDRLECFQAGPFASSDNLKALSHLKAAQEALQRRTKERMARGVEGTHQV